MSYSMTHDADDTFIWTFVGWIDSEEFRRWYADARQMTVNSSLPTLYQVMDVTQADTDFGAILGQMREVGKAPFYAIDQRTINFLFVGTSEMAKLAANLARQPQFGGFTMPMFRTMEDAQEFIRLDRLKRVNITE